MISLGARVAIYGPHEDVYDIPEHHGSARIMDRPVKGYGGMIGDPVTSISAANIERITVGMHQTRYPNESILAHEFGRAIHRWASTVWKIRVWPIESKPPTAML